MCGQGLGPRWAGVLFICHLASACSPVRAEQGLDRHFAADVGIGSETQSSPLFQISPESTILYLPGRQSLKNTHEQLNIQGSVDAPLDQGWSFTLAANGQFKRAFGAPDMNFSATSVSPSVHKSIGTASVGAALSQQILTVGGQRFRTVHGVQWDWTLPQEQSLWAIVGGLSLNKHPSDLSALDSREWSLVVIRQYQKPFSGIDGIDLTSIVGREKNRWGYAELSSHSFMASGAVRWSWLGLDWSLTHSWRHAWFQGSPFPMEPIRRDRTAMADFSVEKKWGQGKFVRAEWNLAHNSSSIRLYNNHYRKAFVGYRQEF